MADRPEHLPAVSTTPVPPLTPDAAPRPIRDFLDLVIRGNTEHADLEAQARALRARLDGAYLVTIIGPDAAQAFAELQANIQYDNLDATATLDGRPPGNHWD